MCKTVCEAIKSNKDLCLLFFLLAVYIAILIAANVMTEEYLS